MPTPFKFNSSVECFCAFCRTERIVYLKRHVSVVDVLLGLLSGLLLMLLVWQDFDARFLIFFAMSVICAEVFVLVRGRLSMPCPHCGFDPWVYKKDPAKAAARVKTFLDVRKNDPMGPFLPPPNLPFIIKKKDPFAKLSTRV